ncbi:heme-degrading domain-containing protein [Dactylosporangium sp. NPDC050688]|uniref:heme-degrading domain-containing protein n=1 Tax=Dactylosporangium sp. NPDC050688 TaxID=3157217 RepID=UPI003407923E
MEDLIAELVAQEERLRFTRFDNDDAWELGSLLVRLGKERGLPITVDIRRHGHQLFHAALPGTAPDNDRWIERKIRVVERLNASSYLVGRRMAAKGQAMDAAYGVDPADFATHGGAFPIRIVDVGVVGVVTVSGLPQADDHALVVEAVGLFLQR